MKNINTNLHERTFHGKTNFQFAVYHGRIPEWLENFPLHWHEEFEIVMISFGTGIVSIDDKKYTCSKGDIIILPPGTIHSFERYNNERYSYYNIVFSLSLLEENPDSLCSQKFFSKYEENKKFDNYIFKNDDLFTQKLFPLVKELSLFWEKEPDENALIIKARLYEILHLIKDKILPISNDIKSNIKNERIKKSILYIKENYSENISIEDIAKYTGLSKTRFMTFFLETTGKSFIQYLNDYRLELAAQELMNTRKSISEIALSCGIESPSYFILLFKRKFGLSPNKYRKNKN